MNTDERRQGHEMNAPTLRRDRAWIYWRQAQTWCPECRALVPGRVVSEGPRVYLDRACPVHGHSRGLLAESLEHFMARSAVPAGRSDAASRPSPPVCPSACGGPCSWHEGPVRRLIVRRSADGGTTVPEKDLASIVAELRARGEPVEDAVTREAADAEALLHVGRTAPSDVDLADSVARACETGGIWRLWVEADGGLPLDALEGRVSRALGIAANAWAPDPDAPLCLSHGRTAGGLAVVLHAPMNADTLDLTRLLACPIWVALDAERIVPACWAAIRGAGNA
jgi:hypothetical protein